MKKRLVFLCAAMMVLALCFGGSTAWAKMYKFSGGPSGGTFQYYASAITSLTKDSLKGSGLKVLASSSGGSIENIRLINANRAQMAVAYAGDVFLARNGKLKNDEKKYEDVLALGYFYGAPAQLVVRADSAIQKSSDLQGKRVGVGNAGSGAAASCELFLTELGIWDNVDRRFQGYRAAADAFKNNQLDAFWLLVGYPNASVIEAALQTDIRLIDVYRDAEEAGLFEKYPYYTKVVIPAGTYKGVDTPTNTYQDSALWVASPSMSAEDAYNLLSLVYSDEGLKFMVETHKSAKAMSIENGLKGVKTPLHPGAEKFWLEKGIL
ncbi:MAG: TAXI family TRAP transporter solute-binding subunit [Desulfatibacillum sp.]|nr:TAXI family TRAP transporter solute-binding subunit [Desulfatibacillum sp.]